MDNFIFIWGVCAVCSVIAEVHNKKSLASVYACLSLLTVVVALIAHFVSK